MWSEREQTALDAIAHKYKTKRSMVLPALYLAQEEKNYLDDEDIAAVAETLDISVTDVHSVIGFYTLFRKEKTGKYIIQFCTDLPCALRGAETFYKELVAHMGLPEGGGTTEDGMFTVEEVVCIAACDKAPCCQINLEYHEDLTLEKVDTILADLRKEAS